MNRPASAVAVLLSVAAAGHSGFAQSQIVDPPVTGTFTAKGGVSASFRFNPTPSSKAVVSGVNRTGEFVLYDVSQSSKGVITLYLLAPPSKGMGTDFYFEALIRQDPAFAPGTYDFQTFKGTDSKPLKGSIFAAIQPERRPASGVSPSNWSASNYASPPAGNAQIQITALDSTGDKVKHARITGTLVSWRGAPPVTFTLSY
jgi:hypothetical protein